MLQGKGVGSFSAGDTRVPVGPRFRTGIIWGFSYVSEWTSS
jgi:hypothetical protein